MMQGYPPLPQKYTPEAFRKWLQSFPEPISYVGCAGIPGGCPAARWLRDETQKPVKVDYDLITVDYLIGYDTPDWLCRFEKKVDKWPDREPIGRRQALNLLTRALRADDDDW